MAPNTKRSGGRSLEGGGGAAPEEGGVGPGAAPSSSPLGRQAEIRPLSQLRRIWAEGERSPFSTLHTHTYSQPYPLTAHMPTHTHSHHTHTEYTYTHTHHAQTSRTPHTNPTHASYTTHRLTHSHHTHPHYIYRHTYLRQTVCLTLHTQIHNPIHSSYTNSHLQIHRHAHKYTRSHHTHYTYISTKHQQTMTQFRSVTQSCLTLGLPVHH